MKREKRKEKTETSKMLNIFNKEQMNTLGVINDHHSWSKNSLSMELFSFERSIFQN